MGWPETAGAVPVSAISAEFHLKLHRGLTSLIACRARTLVFLYNAEMKSWDVIVIGGGIIGLALSIELRKQGGSVLVVERGQPGREASRHQECRLRC